MAYNGAAFKILTLVGMGRFTLHLSVPVVLEYEAATKRQSGRGIALTVEEIDAVIDYLCSESIHHEIHYLWRPALSDAQDEMVLELAVAAGCDFLLTHNVRDFSGSEAFGIEVITPRQFLMRIGAGHEHD